jgi:PAS domain S-box-containing protein
LALNGPFGDLRQTPSTVEAQNSSPLFGNSRCLEECVGDELALKGSSAQPVADPAPSARLSARLALSAAVILVIMGSFEVLQHWLYPSAGNMRAMAIEIVFALVTGTIGVYVALRRQERLVQELSREVAERKKADDALAILSQAVEQSAHLVVITDTEGIFSYVNPEFEKRTGYNKEEVIGRSTRLLKSGKQGQDFYEALWRTILAGDVYRGILINKAKDGSLFYEDETISPIRDQNGAITHFVSTGRDITERIGMEESLRKRQNALQSVYQMAITSGLSFEDVCGQVALSLAGLLDFSHVMVQQMVGGRAKTIAAAVEGKLTRQEAAVQGDALTSNIVSATVEAYEAPAGQPQKYRTHFSVPIRDNAGVIIGSIIAMAQEQRTVGKDDFQLLEIFGSYVAHEIERANFEAQLDYTREMQLLGQVAAGISHEVRNPLGAVLAITEVVCRDLQDNPRYTQHLMHMRTQVSRLSMLMQELLDLGKPLNVEALTRVSLPEVCEEGIKLWKQYAPHRTHEVGVISNGDTHNLRILAESNRIQQVLVNLLENAAQHSPGEKEIRLVLESVHNLEQNRRSARIRVVDRGTGISEQNLRRIFQPFFTTRSGGTGLGLTVVKRIVELYGGAVTLTNNHPAPGCTAQVDFPMAPEEAV